MAQHLAKIFGTEEDKVNCPFYLKMGACRHGDRCSRIHNRPILSQTILLQNMVREGLAAGPRQRQMRRALLGFHSCARRAAPWRSAAALRGRLTTCPFPPLLAVPSAGAAVRPERESDPAGRGYAAGPF